jgi:hypothetical protein
MIVLEDILHGYIIECDFLDRLWARHASTAWFCFLVTPCAHVLAWNRLKIDCKAGCAAFVHGLEHD